jgi:hypothetical protein
MLINIWTPQQVTEFKLSNGSLIKTNEAKRGEREYIKGKSDIFSAAYRYNRGCEFPYNTGCEREVKLRSILSQYDLQGLEKLYRRFCDNKGKLENEKYFLTGPSSKIPWEFGHFGYSSFFVPNRQFSYVIYKGTFLINLSTNEITFPFGTLGGRCIEWSIEGRYVAYATESRIKSKGECLVVKDVFENHNVFEECIDRYVTDITWSPDFNKLALLTSVVRNNFWSTMSTMMGHPYHIYNFYVEVYDKSGAKLYQDKLIDNAEWGSARIVWASNDWR